MMIRRFEFMNSGIYAIQQTDGPVYIGSSVSLMRRLRQHRAILMRGVHENSRLQRAWNKYGETKFIFVVLERCDPEQLIAKEQQHVDAHQQIGKPLFNLRTRVVSSNLGRKFTNGKRALQLKVLWQDPTYRARMILAGKQQHQDIEALRAKAKRQWQDPAFVAAVKRANDAKRSAR